MNPALAAVLRKAWPYLVGAVLVAIIVFQYRQIGGLHEQLGAERAARAVAVDANQTQAETITHLEKSVAHWKDAAAVAEDIREQAGLAADYRAQLERRQADVKEVKTHESPDCQSLLAVDFGARCSALTGRLRELAADR
jgi:hypothetical protein